ncbi:MAG: class I SAM-dependent methyltransferase [Patescibacteria group bacterium]
MVKLENDYERMIPEYHHGMLMYGEHIMRYESVLGAVKGKTVLDIASGSGYGTAALASVAKKVFGVDINEAAIEYSKEHYPNKNIEFITGSGTKIPLDDGSVDTVVSHETIEHIDDYKKFLDEVKRVLKNGGEAIISTPNDDEYPAGNHFHLHQFSVDAFEKLLKKYFKNVTLYYQGAWISAALLDEKEFTTEWRKNVEVFKTQAQPVVKSTYVVAVCSDRKTSKLNSLAAITEPWSDKELRELAQQRDDHMESVQVAHETERSKLVSRVEELEKQLELIKTSRSWRYTQPLRHGNHPRKK